MKNELIDTSITTALGQWPMINTLNNQAIREEFDLIRSSDNKMILDVSANDMTCRNGKFVNLNVSQLNILDGTSNLNLKDYITSLINSNTYVSALSNQAQLLEKAVFKVDSQNESGNPLPVNVYGASLSSDEYDMSNFFAMTPKGVVPGLQTEDLYHVTLYRVIDNIKIPLSVGTIVAGGKLRHMVYHDHIMVQNNTKKVERVFVAVVNSNDKTSVIQYGPAETIVL